MHLTHISQRHPSKPIWLVRKAWTGGGLRCGLSNHPLWFVVCCTHCSRSLNILCTFSTLYFSNHGHRFVVHPVHLQQPQIGILCPLVHPNPHPASSHLGVSLPEIGNLYWYPSICVFPPIQIWLQYTMCIFICVTVFVYTCIFVFRITHAPSCTEPPRFFTFRCKPSWNLQFEFVFVYLYICKSFASSQLAASLHETDK